MSHKPEEELDGQDAWLLSCFIALHFVVTGATLWELRQRRVIDEGWIAEGVVRAVVALTFIPLFFRLMTSPWLQVLRRQRVRFYLVTGAATALLAGGALWNRLS